MFLSDLRHPSPSLQDKLGQLYSLNRTHTIDLSFRPPFLDLLTALGNPERHLPPVIHVAGTNGKGSVIAFLRTILEGAGYRVHTYTSPHLVQFNERILLQGKPIENTALEALIDEVLALNGGREVTFFEITTALAFAAFARAPADLCLLEVGLGGRLDCTNVIENPLLTVINTIGLDHTEFLGDTLAQIAFEKAGIMKPHVPCVIGPQSAAAQEAGVPGVFETVAADRGSPLFQAGEAWSIARDGDHIVFTTQNGSKVFAPPALAGPHQIQNMGVALAALDQISAQYPVTDTEIQKGLQTVFWPARLQRLSPLAYGLDGAWELWLDGGHNAEAAQTLAAQAKIWREADARPLHIVMGMMGHKNIGAFLAPLLSFAETLTFVNITGEPKALSAQALQEAAGTGQVAPDVFSALEDLYGGHPSGGRVLICGSLYLAGEVLSVKNP